MQYRIVPKTGDRLSALGFGFMRLPLTKIGSIDENRAVTQLRYAIDQGVNYVDTAPAYHLGRSEKILARALEDGYREKVRIATKLPPWSVTGLSDMDRILSAQQGYFGPGPIEYYLLHSLTRASWKKMERLGVLSFLDSAVSERRIRYAGFSFHGDYETFQEIVDAYDWDFCQIQYNYLDENNQAGTRGLVYAASRDLAVMVMEPIRGGNLAGPVPRPVQEIWNESRVQRSPAEWALLWVLDHPEVTVALSGMNQELHIEENLRTASTALPHSLTAQDLSLISRVRDTYTGLMKVGCTGCGYCMPCPSGVDIPGCFSLYNAHHLFPRDLSARFHYIGRHGGLISSDSSAGLCTRCGKCERICPQHLPIRDHLAAVSQEMEWGMGPLVTTLRGGLWCLNTAARARRFFSRGKRR